LLCLLPGAVTAAIRAGIAAGVGLALLLGLVLMLAGLGLRQRRGLGGGRTVSLDRMTLTSHAVTF
jgi:hypothetical protein